MNQTEGHQNVLECTGSFQFTLVYFGSFRYIVCLILQVPNHMENTLNYKIIFDWSLKPTLRCA